MHARWWCTSLVCTARTGALSAACLAGCRRSAYDPLAADRRAVFDCFIPRAGRARRSYNGAREYSWYWSTPELERHCSGVNACLRIFTRCGSSKCVLRTERLYEQTHLDPAPDDYS